MATQRLKGLWIPAEILLNEELTDKEKIILAMILYLSEETKSCFASNKYIANIVNVTADRVSKIIGSLREKNYIKVKLKYKTDCKEIEQRQISPFTSRYPSMVQVEARPSSNPFRMRHLQLSLTERLSAWAKEARSVSMTSPSASRVLMFCSSKKTLIPSSFSSRTVRKSVTVFLAKRLTDFVMTISMVPARQSDRSC